MRRNNPWVVVIIIAGLVIAVLVIVALVALLAV